MQVEFGTQVLHLAADQLQGKGSGSRARTAVVPSFAARPLNINLFAPMKLLVVGKNLSQCTPPPNSVPQDCEIVSAKDDSAALEILEGPVPPEIALIDRNSPYKGGIELCKKFREHKPGAPTYLVLYGLQPDTRDIIEGLDAGADDCWVHPIDHPETCARLRAALRRTQKFSTSRPVPCKTNGVAHSGTRGAAEIEGQAAASLQENVDSIPGLKTFHDLIARTLSDMCLGDAEPVELPGRPKSPPPEYSMLHCMLLPEKSLWLDFLLECDRESAIMLFQTFVGGESPTAADLQDSLGETLNMIQGAFKTAFRAQSLDVITPVVPQAVSSEKLAVLALAEALRKTYKFDFGNMHLLFTMVAHNAPLINKRCDEIALADVLAESLRPNDGSDLVLIQKGTLLNVRYLKKVRDIAEFAGPAWRHQVIKPSPIAKLLQVN